MYSRPSSEVLAEHINEMISQAVVHGGDAGGPYCSNDEKLIESMKSFSKWYGLDSEGFKIIKNTDGSYSFGQIVN